MTSVSAKKGNFSLTAYRGDAKTLLAFNLTDKQAAADLAGFTIQCTPKGQQSYYLFNELQYETPADHAQDPKESPRSSVNAPIFKFRWVHIPGAVHQGIDPFFGDYTYTVTPRHLKNGALQPLDSSLSASVTIPVQEFVKGNLELGFTRGYTQSQAFDGHFGKDALIQPNPPKFMFDTSVQSGKNAQGETFTFQQEYQWLGFTAREKVFGLLNDVLKNASSAIDVFAYNLDEPDALRILLELAKQNRIRIVLDDSKDNHDAKKPTAEDQFETAFKKAAGGKTLMQRGHFNRYAHDKVVIVYSDLARKNPLKVLTGATNFSVTGMYVNSNHVLIYNDPQVAGIYAGIFNEVWTTGIKEAAFVQSPLSNKTFSSTAANTPKTSITFAPHNQAMTSSVLKTITDRIAVEAAQTKRIGSVLFAVMQIDTTPPKAKAPTGKGKSKTKSKTKPKAPNNPVYVALNALHKNDKIFSYGISDSPDGISLYPIGQKTGVLVTGKPINTVLPPPFNQVRNIGGFGHQVHHKFVVCGFNDPTAAVFCGSSNLSNGGENSNGDNLLEIQDADIATVFAIEALALVDHFDFLDRSSKGKVGKDKTKTPAPASKHQAAMDAHMFLPTDDKWTAKYFDPKDLHSVDRQLFGGVSK